MSIRLKTLFVLLVALSCTRVKAPLQDPVAANTPTTNNVAFALINASDVKTPSKVNAVRLDEVEFRVNQLRVGEKLYLQYNTPVIAYQIPNAADYLEILRCKTDALISGGADYLNQLEVKTADTATETHVFQRNNFWESASQNSNCKLIGTSLVGTSFEDTLAQTNNYTYYARACVDPNRLLDTTQFSTMNCSRQVTGSNSINYVNKRSQSDLNTMEEIAELRDKIDTLNLQIKNKLLTLESELYSCQVAQKKAIDSAQNQSNIRNIVSIASGAGIGATAATAFAVNGARSTVSIAGIAGRASGAVAIAAGAAAIATTIFDIATATENFPQLDFMCQSSPQETLAHQAINGQPAPTDAQAYQICTCQDALTTKIELETQAENLTYYLQLTQMKWDELGNNPAALNNYLNPTSTSTTTSTTIPSSTATDSTGGN